MISCQEMEDKGFICPCNKSIHRRDYGILSFMCFFFLHFNPQTHKTQCNKVTLTFCYFNMGWLSRGTTVLLCKHNSCQANIREGADGSSKVHAELYHTRLPE